MNSLLIQASNRRLFLFLTSFSNSSQINELVPPLNNSTAASIR